MSMQTQQGQSGRPLTGAMVLAMLLAFFGIVIAVNLVMFRLASSTFSGLEERNAYTAGVSHNRALLAAKAQDERGWLVDARLRRAAEGGALLVIERKDSGGDVAGLVVTARFEHPAMGREDRRIVLAASGSRQWRASVDLPAGAWHLVIEMRAGAELMFLSRERVQVIDAKIESDG